MCVSQDQARQLQLPRPSPEFTPGKHDEVLGIKLLKEKASPKEARLLKRLEKVDDLPPADQRAVLKFVDAPWLENGASLPKARLPIAAKRASLAVTIRAASRALDMVPFPRIASRSIGSD